jgi:DNA-binding response OmpR family regulator
VKAQQRISRPKRSKPMPNENKVIVVEDDRDINDLVTYNLRKEGFVVEQAFDGDAASERLRDEYFGIVILDIMLPGISGFDICKTIKENDLSSKSFVIVISARGSSQDKLYAHILGASCYLSKPFKVGELIKIAREVRALQDKVFMVVKP